MGRQNEYRVRAYAQYIAEITGGEFVDKEYEDAFGKYWIVIWRAEE